MKRVVWYFEEGGVALVDIFPYIFPQMEDPTRLAARLASAHSSRRAFEAYIRYSLFVDSMPIDELQPLDQEQTARILTSALNSKLLKANGVGMINSWCDK